MAPFLLFGFFATALSVWIVKPDFIERHLGGGNMSSLKASLLGVPLPLCSCSVIPVASTLYRHGASRGATIAFLISTPQTGIDSFFVTYSLLGPLFAVLRPVAAFISGIAGGVLIDRFTAEKKDAGLPATPPHSNAEKCECHQNGSGFMSALRYGFITLPSDIGNALLMGLIISALISTFFPPNFLGTILGTGLKPMLIMMIVAIPMYVCATASVPVAAAFLLNGVTPGAALVFLMAGPATNAATIATIWKIMGRKTAVIYLLVVAVFSLLFGWALDSLFSAAPLLEDPSHQHHAGLPSFIKDASAVLLFALLFITRIINRQKDERH